MSIELTSLAVWVEHHMQSYIKAMNIWGQEPSDDEVAYIYTAYT